uniref:Eukaryotic translation initiation factor 2 subunit beta n=1 Tax=Tetraselmis sp. GSL018 TaxID=582737 RepID=A0A061S037_9CHLO|mmetsp:Transcript_37555/g.89242  ORF Transcript_37555/g.89242 Transcript_37555/m.89242 type:complete len:282 (+) Transcript_37555:102-947(+)
MAEDNPASVAEKMEDLSVDSDLFSGEKKKKKKKKPLLDLDGPAPGEEGSEAAAPAGEEVAQPAEAADLDLNDLTLNLKKKKKKKAKARDMEDFAAFEGEEGGEGAAAEGSGPSKSGLPWDGTDRDYTYDELLGRVFGILHQNNPELTGERRRTIMKPPQVAREGTKKTVFINFMDLCKAMNRQPEHMQAFLMAELGTSGSLDGQQRLIVKGKFMPKAFEAVLRRYVNDYVLCPLCKSPDTLLDREQSTRLMYLRCQQCGASRTVAAIKQGFQARVTRRPRG